MSGEESEPNRSTSSQAQRSVLIGDTTEETLYNIGCVLQVLSDAATAQLTWIHSTRSL